MYCAQCGKQIPDDAVFCSACGAKTHSGADSSPRSYAGSVTRAMPDFRSVKSMRIASIGCNVLILLLLFTKLFRVQIPVYGSRDCSVFDLLSLFSKFEGLWNELGVDFESGSLVFILLIVLVAVVGSFIFIIRYFYKEWSWNPETCNNEHILADYPGMEHALVTMILVFISFFVRN